MKTSILFLMMVFSIVLWSSPVLFLSVDSYIGSYYYPYRADKEFSYNEYHDIRLGAEKVIVGPTILIMEVGHNEKLLDQAIKLRTMRISYQPTGSWEFSFCLDDIGYGKRTEWFDNDITNPDFRDHLLGNYRFAGMELYHSFSRRIGISSYLGGNIHNTAISGADITYYINGGYFKIFNLNVGRDNQFNKQMYSFGSELRWTCSFLEIFHAHSYQYLSSHFERENYVGYMELKLPLKRHLTTGGNYYHAKSLRGYSRWREVSLQIEYQFSNLEWRLQAGRLKAQDLVSERIGSILMYRLTNNLSFGINSAVNYPQYKDEYYSVGMQISYAQILNR